MPSPTLKYYGVDLKRANIIMNMIGYVPDWTAEDSRAVKEKIANFLRELREHIKANA